MTTNQGSDRGLVQGLVRAWRPQTAYKHTLACFCTYFLSFLSLVSLYSAIHTVASLCFVALYAGPSQQKFKIENVEEDELNIFKITDSQKQIFKILLSEINIYSLLNSISSASLI